MISSLLLMAATVTAVSADKAPRIDGRLDDAVWQGAATIDGLVQRNPEEGKASPDRTRVWIAFDRDHLYVAVRADQRGPLQHYYLQPDFSLGDDSIALLIDPWKDRRNGYLFVVNPNGARKDLLATGSGAHRNMAWNGIWWAETSRDDGGWSVEMRIPFSTLSFPARPLQSWGFNVQRRNAQAREEAVWQGWQRRFGFVDPGVAGTLEGLRGIRSGQRAEIKPYVMGGVHRSEAEGASALVGLGGDVDMLLNPRFKISLTINPDFAQVESDQAQLNLSHHSLYLPEQRPFFLEGKDLFSFGTSSSNQPFYSRRVGLDAEGEALPILTGLRLLGRTKTTRIGLLTAQVARDEFRLTDSTNASALRVTRNVLKRSSVGALMTSADVDGVQRQTMGLDLRLRSTELIPKRTVELTAAGAMSFGPGFDDRGETWRIALAWPNAIWNARMSWERIGADYDPALGFVALSGVDRISLSTHHTHYIKDPKSVLRNRQFSPFSGSIELDDSSGEWGHYAAHIVPVELVSRSGLWGKLSLDAKGYRLSGDWEILDGFTAPAGEHHSLGAHAMIANGWHRRLGLFAMFSEGQYFGGRMTSSRLWAQMKVSPRLRISTSNGLYWMRGGGSEAIGRDHNLRVRVSLNRSLHGSLFGQWNSQTDETLINLRIRIIPAPGADAYIVLNQGLDADGADAGTSLQGKLVWRFGV